MMISMVLVLLKSDMFVLVPQFRFITKGNKREKEKELGIMICIIRTSFRDVSAFLAFSNFLPPSSGLSNQVLFFV